MTTAAVAVVGPEGTLAATGPQDAPLRWASVTKLLTALAALTQVRHGVLDLDEPAGPPGSTVRHLLAHASGLSASDGTTLSAPGRRRIYSNRGFEVLADFVSERAGTPFPELLTTAVLRPLDLAGTSLSGSPASGAAGPLDDLARLGRELLSPTLAPALMDEATRVQFPDLSGVLPGFGRQEHNDWGLGFEIRDHKQPHWTGAGNSPETFGHFGQAGGFLWVDQDVGLACACLTDRAFGDWAAEVWPALSDQVLAEFG